MMQGNILDIQIQQTWVLLHFFKDQFLHFKIGIENNIYHKKY